MKIEDIKDRQGDINIDLKVIYDQFDVKQRAFKDGNTRKIKAVVVADIDSESKEDGETALLDLWDEDVEKFKKGDKLRVVNGFAKRVKTRHSDNQAIINYGFNGKEKGGHYEKIESE